VPSCAAEVQNRPLRDNCRRAKLFPLLCLASPGSSFPLCSANTKFRSRQLPPLETPRLFISPQNVVLAVVRRPLQLSDGLWGSSVLSIAQSKPCQQFSQDVSLVPSLNASAPVAWPTVLPVILARISLPVPVPSARAPRSALRPAPPGDLKLPAGFLRFPGMAACFPLVNLVSFVDRQAIRRRGAARPLHLPCLGLPQVT